MPKVYDRGAPCGRGRRRLRRSGLEDAPPGPLAAVYRPAATGTATSPGDDFASTSYAGELADRRFGASRAGRPLSLPRPGVGSLRSAAPRRWKCAASVSEPADRNAAEFRSTTENPCDRVPEGEWAAQYSNQRPTDYESAAAAHPEPNQSGTPPRGELTTWPPCVPRSTPLYNSASARATTLAVETR